MHVGRSEEPIMRKTLFFLSVIFTPSFVFATNYAALINYLYPTAINGEDFAVRNDGSGPYISLWKVATLGVEPSKEYFENTESSPAYLTWFSAHGGDPVATIKQIAKDGQDASDDRSRVQRAAVKLTVDEINAIRDGYTKLLEAIASATSLADLKARVAANVPPLPQRTYGQAKTAISNIIDGE